MDNKDTHENIPRIQFKVGRNLHRDFSDENHNGEAADASLEQNWWKLIVWGAAALCVTVIVLMLGPEWLLLLGPFILIILVRAMKIRSLW